MRPLRVMHILPHLGIGGMEKFAVDLIKRFDRQAVAPEVICLRNGYFADVLRESGIEVFILEKKKYHEVAFHKKLTALLKNKKTDVVHSWSGIYRDAVISAMLARIHINVHTDQGKLYPDTRRARFDHWLFSHFRDRVIAVSDELRNFLINDIRINPAKVVKIYNAVDISEHDINVNNDYVKKTLGLASDTKIIGIVARLAVVKDHATLLHAFKNVRSVFGNVKLLVVGDGILKEKLQKLVSDLSETQGVMFLGKRNDVKSLLHIMDVVCLSSLSEGLSLTLTEAMASGKPIVATNVGGNPELIVNGVTGFLVPPESPDEMANAILKLLRNDELRISMGQKGRERVKKEFDINGIAKEYEKLYFELAVEKGVI